MLKRLDIKLRAQREVVELVDPLEAFELEDGADRQEHVIGLCPQRPCRRFGQGRVGFERFMILLSGKGLAR